jgi:hypothetical protein
VCRFDGRYITAQMLAACERRWKGGRSVGVGVVVVPRWRRRLRGAGHGVCSSWNCVDRGRSRHLTHA